MSQRFRCFVRQMCWIVLEGKPNRLPQVSLDGIKSALQNCGFDEVSVTFWNLSEVLLTLGRDFKYLFREDLTKLPRLSWTCILLASELLFITGLEGMLPKI